MTSRLNCFQNLFIGDISCTENFSFMNSPFLIQYHNAAKPIPSSPPVPIPVSNLSSLYTAFFDAFFRGFFFGVDFEDEVLPPFCFRFSICL